jgi:FKBP-type peptidyl-prolyl cis-trans isomerase
MARRWTMVVGMVMLAAAAVAQDAQSLKGSKERSSYAVGFDFGNQIKKLYVDLDPALLNQGINDSLSGRRARLTEDEIRSAISELQAEMKRRKALDRMGKDDPKAAENNKRAGEVFLAENSRKEGVATLPSGLQYRILKARDGKRPTPDDTVICQYVGNLIDGTEFDNSYRRNQPVTVALKGVIKGWSEALQLMPVGSKWRLFVPPQLAYGESGSGPVGPNSTLIFEVELLAIK